MMIDFGRRLPVRDPIRRDFEARYAGTCAACGGQIEVGDKIDWDSVRKLVRHAGGACPEQPPLPLAPAPTKPSYPAIVKLFEAANFLRCRMRLTWEGRNVYLYRTGEKSRNPGRIHVIEDRDGDTSVCASILPNAQLNFISRNAPWALELLDALEADPAGAASAHGKATGLCSFCGRDLTDERSVSVGYGPVCAERWGLPWG